MDGLYGPIYIRSVYVQVKPRSLPLTDISITRPRRIAENLVSMINNDTLEQAQIHNAIKCPHLVMLSDWFHMTSEELREVAISADVDIL